MTRFEPDSGAWASFVDPAWALAPSREGISRPDVTSLAIAADGSVWATEYSGILSHLAPGSGKPADAQWQDYFPPSFVNQSPTLPVEAYKIKLGPDGSLWIVGAGLTRLDPTTGDIQHNPLAPAWNPQSGDSTTALAFAQDRSLWIGTHGFGLIHFFPDPTAGTPEMLVYTAADGLVDNHVTAIAIAPDGSLWVGTFRGVSHCTTGN